MAVNPKDANDIAVSLMGSFAIWVGDNVFQAVGMVCTVLTLIFVVRRYYRDAETVKLQQELLRRQISQIGVGADE